MSSKLIEDKFLNLVLAITHPELSNTNYDEKEMLAISKILTPVQKYKIYYLAEQARKGF